MGYYSIITSETNVDDIEVINRYHGLSRIEDSFRVIKSEFEGRPVYVRTKEHINAHFLICFISLTIMRILQYKILEHQGKNTKISVEKQIRNREQTKYHMWTQGLPPKRISEALKNYKICSDINGICLTTKITNDLQLIFDSVDFDNTFKEPTIVEMNKIRNRFNKKQIM